MAEETMKDFERELEASFRKINVGDILKGTVVDVNDAEVTLDLKYYAPGIIKAENLSADPGFSAVESIHKGDEIEAAVTRIDDGRGNIELSIREAADTLGWERLQEAKKEEKTLEVTIREAVKGGCVAFAEGIRGFIPASRLSADYVEDLDSFVGKKLMVRVIELDQEKNKLILSAREIQREAQEEERNHEIAMLVPGTVVEGTVESIMPYGAFVSLGKGLSGLVHISQFTERRIKSPKEVVSEGQKVKVKILNTKDGKVSLTMKGIEGNGIEEEQEEIFDVAVEDYTSDEQATTSLGSLLSGITL